MKFAENQKKAQDETKALRALADSQARMSGIISSAMDAIITADSDQRITLFNRSAEEIFGYRAEDVIGQPIDLLIPGRFREKHHHHIRRFGETGVTNRNMGRLGTLYGLRANGEEFPIEASISQVAAAEGHLYTVILRDVSERVKAEQLLRENEMDLRASFDQAAVGILHAAPDGRLLRVNQKLCEITGYSPEELLQRSIQDITFIEDIEADLHLHEELLQGHIHTYSREKRYVRKDGSLVWVNLTASLVNDLAGKPRYLVKFAEDITQRKAAEEALQAKNNEMKTMTQQLWQTAKLATMGELAASIAHELNNPLAIVSLRIESLMGEIDAGLPAYGELKVIENEVERMAALVSNLLQFSRSSDRQISSLQVEDEINQTLELVQNYLAHRSVKVVREYAPNLPMIQADRQQLRQLFLNLITNASDAMPGGGTLRIRVEYDLTGQKVWIEFIDTGTGISPEHIRSVMEPFFTTKPEGKGTGLGLAICRRIIEEHGGSIKISSPGLNQGTSIQMTLPGVSQSKMSFALE